MKPKRITAFLLSVAMTISLLPTFTLTASADETPTTTTEKNITLGTAALSGYDSTNGYDYIYFGNWTAADKYTTTAPIKWRVLDDKTNFDSNNDGTNDDGLFLLSDELFGTGDYGNVSFQYSRHEDSNSGQWYKGEEHSNGNHANCQIANAWQGSEAQEWCKNFYNNNLTTQEQSVVLATTKSDAEYTSSAMSTPFAASANILNGDKVFFLSAEEAENGKYGFADTYALGAYYGENIRMWWLRSSKASESGLAGAIWYYWVSSYSTYYNSMADRPAFNIDTNSILFTTGKGVKKNIDVGNVNVNGDYTLSENETYDYKLTLKREYAEGEEFGAEQKEISTQKGRMLKFEYSNAKTGDDEYISAMITDKDGKEVLYYGQLAKVTQASGNVELKIPTDIACGDYKVKLFNEQINGDYKTDFASDFVDFDLTVKLVGDGSAENPYLIYYLSDLEYFRDKVNDGTYQSAYVKLMDDIDMSEKYGEGKTSWTPIGTDSTSFSGTFDGNSHTISNLYINTSENNIGLFKRLGTSATVKKLAVENGNITGGIYVGGIAAEATGGNTIENCSYSGMIDASNSAGGIAGAIGNGTSVKNCYSIATVGVTIIPDMLCKAGGIVGDFSSNDCTISNNYYLSGRLTCTTTPEEKSGEIETKSADEFENGSVAHLLQNGQASQVWGQQLVNTAPDGETSNKDSYPVLTSDGDKKVNKITFMQKDGESTFKEYAVKYANKKLAKADFPTNLSTDANYNFWWSENKNNVKFDENTELTGDKTVYAMSGEKTEASDKSDKITLNKNTETEIDLGEYVQNKSGNTENNFAFELAEEQTLPAGLKFDESTGKITGKPTKVGTYTVKFNVANNGISLMSLESVNNVDVLTLKFDVDFEGEGTEAKPYLIYDLSELEYFRDKVNGGTTYEGKHIKLMNNIDMAGYYGASVNGTEKSWDPISYSKDNGFKGTFDGNGKEIQNICINDESYSCSGLFGRIGESEIKNLGVTGSITASDNIGGIIGENNGTIENCYYKGTVSGYRYVGGIAGNNYGTIKNCYSVAAVSGGENSEVGGITGNNESGAGVNNCYYLDDCVTKGIDSKIGTAKTEAEFNSGSVAWLLQNGQTSQLWGQKLNEADSTKNDKYPVLTSESDKKVYKVAQTANTPAGGNYTENSAVYGNDNQALTLNSYKGAYTNKFYGWAADKNSRTLIDKYTINKADAEVYSVWNELTFDV